ncbi:MAG: hypothetical protein H6659_17345 [Ardenticatenaceae bacterium]|nr:hypothetical protein [Ardenticatenaceae bacterium]
MANLLQAVNAYGPKLDLNKTAQLDRVVAWMSSRTGVNKSEVMMVLQELHEALIFFASEGTPVKLPGVGTFTPTMNRKGEIRIAFRPDAALKKALRDGDDFVGRMKNKSAASLTNEDLKAKWDAEHPDDPLVY